MRSPPFRRIGDRMRIANIVPALLCLVLAVPAVRAQDAGEQTVTAEGMGVPSGGDKAKARDQAIDNALRRAVEQTVGTLIESSTATDNYEVLDDRIYTQARGFVKSYK